MQYFKHLSSMRNDPKIKRVIAKYGLEGYGLYNLMLESIAGSVETNNPMPFLEETCEDIAMFYNGNSAKIEEMVRFMISQGLFSVETVEKRIACFKIYKYFEQSQTRSEKIRELISEYHKQVDLPQMSQTNLIEENRKEENRKEKKPRASKKIVERKPYGEFQNVMLSDAEYKKYYDELGETAFNAVIEYLSAYCESKGKDYPSHAGAMRTWAIQAVRERRPELFQQKKPAEKSQMDLAVEAMIKREYAERGQNART